MNRFGLGVVLGAAAVYAVWAWTIVKLDQANALLDSEPPTVTVKKYGTAFNTHQVRISHGRAQTIEQPLFRERGDC